MKVLLLIPSLDYGGAARQLVLLATGLPRDQFTLRVCTLGRSTPWAETLCSAGIEVEVLAQRHAFDVQPWLRLRQAMRAFQPDVLHVWGLPRLWLGPCLRRWTGAARLLISAFLPARNHSRRLTGLDRLALRLCDYQVIVSGPAEAEHCRRLGLPEERIVQIPPAVALPDLAATSTEAIRRSLGLPLDARLLFGVGPLEPHRGLYDAVWALDFLKYLGGDLHLVLVGRGSDQPRMEHFAHAIHVRDQVHWLGNQPDVMPLLRLAEVVWAPNQRWGGTNVALEAMAAARPVVASHLPGLAEIIHDGETGFLFPPGDKATLAWLTRRLLDDVQLRRAMGAAGRKRVETHFTVKEMVRRYVALYAGK